MISQFSIQHTPAIRSNQSRNYWGLLSALTYRFEELEKKINFMNLQFTSSSHPSTSYPPLHIINGKVSFGAHSPSSQNCNFYHFDSWSSCIQFFQLLGLGSSANIIKWIEWFPSFLCCMFAFGIINCVCFIVSSSTPREFTAFSTKVPRGFVINKGENLTTRCWSKTLEKWLLCIIKRVFLIDSLSGSARSAQLLNETASLSNANKWLWYFSIEIYAT